MVDIHFNKYFIKNYNYYDLHGHTHHIGPKSRSHTGCYNYFFIYKAYKI